MVKFEDWYEVLEKELCCEMKKFEENPTHETLEDVEKLIKSICGLQELEAGRAMRNFAEDRYGYDMESGEFDGMGEQHSRHMMYNAGRGGRRSRDSRGRYTSNPRNAGGMPMGDRREEEYFGMDDMDGYGRYYYPQYIPPMYNEGGRSNGRSSGGNSSGGSRTGSGSRDGRSGNMYNDGRMGYDDGHPYMLRQDGGRPIMTPYAMHDMNSIPKKLTNEQYDEWMENLANADGSSGPHWTIEQTKQVQQKKGMEKIDAKAFWAAMNASYSDLCEFFKKHNINSSDAYAEYAKVFWFEDEDAVGGGEDNAEKLAAYFTAVVE